MKKKNYISQGGLHSLLSEVEKLNRERAEVVKVVQWAAGNGDRSENADYLYGKRRMRDIDSRLRHLNSRIEHAHVVNYENNDVEKIFFGATITVVDDEEIQKSYTLVGADEVCIEKNHISIESPIGKNLLGKIVGDRVEIRTPNGEFVFEVIAIHYVRWDGSHDGEK